MNKARIIIDDLTEEEALELEKILLREIDEGVLENFPIQDCIEVEVFT